MQNKTLKRESMSFSSLKHELPNLQKSRTYQNLKLGIPKSPPLFRNDL